MHESICTSRLLTHRKLHNKTGSTELVLLSVSTRAVVPVVYSRTVHACMSVCARLLRRTVTGGDDPPRHVVISIRSPCVRFRSARR
jgi:hypothetical protein